MTSMMDRRAFIAGGIGLLATPRTTEGQLSRKTARLAVLSAAPPPAEAAEAFQGGLRDHGWVEGANLTVDYRFAGGRDENLDDLAAEMVTLKPDVIAALSTPAVVAASRATHDVPIVMVAAVDPVGLRLIASLARPGRNITGTTFHSPETAGKIVELIAATVPRLQRLVVLGDSSYPGWSAYWQQAEAAARAKGISLRLLEARRPEDLATAFAGMNAERPDALYVVGTSAMRARRGEVGEFARQRKLPAIYTARLWVDLGGLMAYGPDVTFLYRRAGYYIDRILKGTAPGDLPVEQPSRFELIINQKTARALGLTIPPSVLLRADHVIE